MDFPHSKSEEEVNDEKLVYDFPYANLRDVPSADLEYVRKCLPHLLKISQTSIFYTNLKAVRLTLEFTINVLNAAPFQALDSKETFGEVLTLLRELLLGSMKYNKFSNIFPDISPVFHLVFYVSELGIFCAKSASICEPILQQMLNKVGDYMLIDKLLSETLDNFQKIGALVEMSRLSDTVLRGFPLESSTYKLCACWLTQNALEIFSQLTVGPPENDAQFASLMNNISTLLLKVASAQSNPMVEKYQQTLLLFVAELKSLTPTLIELCGREACALTAKALLGHVLVFFLEEQDMYSDKAVNTSKEDIVKFPAKVEDWPNQCCGTFFWLCHLVYQHQKTVWPTEAICTAIGRLLYSKQHLNLINPSVLKSVFFVYPIILQTNGKIIKKRIIGNDLLNVVLPRFMRFLDKILTISTGQLLWILYKGPWSIKTATLEFWLKNAEAEQLETMEEVLVASKSQKLLIYVLLSLKDPHSPVANRLTEVIENLRGRVTFKEILVLLPQISDNMERVSALLKIACGETPEDNTAAKKLFKYLHLILTKQPGDNLLSNVCCLASNALNVLKTDKDFIQAICAEQFWFRYLISRLNGRNEKLLKAILALLTKLISYQDMPVDSSQPICINLSQLFTISPEVSAKVVAFLHQSFKVQTPFAINKDIILDVFDKLCQLTESPLLSDKVYGCLMGLLKMYPDELIHSPILGMLVEEQCRLTSRKMNTSESLKFVLFWIKMKYRSGINMCGYLPKEGLMAMFFQRSMGIPKYMMNRYLFYISEIYDRQESLTIDNDPLNYVRRLFKENHS
ncbi:uncharacterized protein LOC109543813 [Dendroctonus ponderosae]|uniref:Methyl methanesulfonate-sensitivity protein 22-like n=1 Tax=Dendroctonus ponderosae TaxID=77166 RepID=A0AAR5Q7P4_DENPD|nr:uncharacterized protein LOC109543813 [Dendroctonus ponderosae]KAH1008093.1 hypothetical protein HUJ04_005236 [Dendroctonus ponderosae]KAH1015585.1 hypothetical protein HUJ05_013284 [Dendroctonus ponderosae]